MPAKRTGISVSAQGIREASRTGTFHRLHAQTFTSSRLGVAVAVKISTTASLKYSTVLCMPAEMSSRSFVVALLAIWAIRATCQQRVTPSEYTYTNEPPSSNTYCSHKHRRLSSHSSARRFCCKWQRPASTAFVLRDFHVHSAHDQLEPSKFSNTSAR